MDTTTSIIVSKIEKLWRKASDAAATPAEREAFESKALSLMEEHRVTMAMLEIDQEDILGDYSYGMVEGRYSRAVLQIISSIARAYDCRIWWKNHSAGRKDVFVFGFRSDADRVSQLSRMLIADAQAQAAREQGHTGPQTFSIRRGFLLGFAQSIAERLTEAASMANKAVEEARGVEAVHGAALVLVDRRTQMHEAYSRKRLRSASPLQRANATGYTRGVAAGQTASLSTQGRVTATKALSA